MPLQKLNPQVYLSLPGRDDLWVFILPDAGRQMALTVIEAAGWRGKYSPVPDDADWSVLQTLQEGTVAGLLGGVKLSEILAEFDETQAILQAILAAQCCTPGSAADFVGTNTYGNPADLTVGSGPVPDAFAANPLADYDSSGTIGWDDYAVYLCDAAYRLADGLEGVLYRMRSFSALDAATENILSELIQLVIRKVAPQPWEEFAIIGWEGWLNLFGAFDNWITGQPTLAEWDTILQTWSDTVRQQLICHVSEAASADTAAADVRSDMQSLFGSVTWDALWALYPFGRILRKVFEGAEAYEGPIQDCECALDAGVYATYEYGGGSPVRFPAAGTLTTLTAYTIPTGSSPLSNGDMVRVKFFDAADDTPQPVMLSGVEVINYTTVGLNQTAYPKALDGFNPFPGRTIQITHAAYSPPHDFATPVDAVDGFTGNDANPGLNFTIDSVPT